MAGRAGTLELLIVDLLLAAVVAGLFLLERGQREDAAPRGGVEATSPAAGDAR